MRARPVDGAANAALVAVLAEAFDLRRSAVTVVAGARSADKLVDLAGDELRLRARLAELYARDQPRR